MGGADNFPSYYDFERDFGVLIAIGNLAFIDGSTMGLPAYQRLRARGDEPEGGCGGSLSTHLGQIGRFSGRLSGMISDLAVCGVEVCRCVSVLMRP
jgi:hypothetical protein